MALLFLFQPVGNITDRVAAGELTENHADELAPRVISFAMLVGPCCPNDFSDIFFRQFADCLSEKCYICHKEVVLMGIIAKIALLF